MTNGSHTVRRQVTWKKPDGTTGSTPLCFGSEKDTLPEGAVPCVIEGDKYYYPSHIASDFYHHYKEDIKLCAQKKASSASVFPSSGQVSSQMEMMQNRMKKD
jgi:6-phospho-beta-glucosidase